MSLAILKPDHLGDLVLSSPAIRAMAKAVPDTTLFVAERCRPLAAWLFPDLATRTLNMPHLAKQSPGRHAHPDLTAFDEVALLRNDGVLGPEWAQTHTRSYVTYTDDNSVHQTMLDYGVARSVAGPYDIDAAFFQGREHRLLEKAAGRPAKVGLSIGSGFYTNVWPLVRWIALAKALRRADHQVFVVCGPAEAPLARLLLQRAGLPSENLILGGGDFPAFSRRVDELGLVIGSDGGTAHLCSITTPVLSIFGSSPLKRYAPFGRANRVITQALSCSPCVQFAERLVNGCLSVECMAAVTPQDVLLAMGRRPALDPPAPAVDTLRPGLVMYTGLSHVRRAEQIAVRDAEAEMWAP